MFSETGVPAGVPGCEVNSWDSWISAAVKVSNVGNGSTSDAVVVVVVDDGSDLSCFFNSFVVFAVLSLDGVTSSVFTSSRRTNPVINIGEH